MTRLAVLGTWCLLACGGDADPTFSVVAEGQPSSLLSVWGTTGSDVWVVGGDPRNETGPIALHYDGSAWTKHDTGLRNVDLWWVYGFAGGPVFMSGSNGKIIKFENGTFETMPTPGTLIVFGMWGAAPNDVWAVGGNFSGGGFAWHYDGTAWTEQAGVPAELKASGTLFKVGGRASNDVWMVGTTGNAIRWNGTALEPITLPTDASLLSVSGNSKRFVAAGGNFDGVLFETTDGATWKSVLPQGGPVLTGIIASEDAAYAVGSAGTILKRGGDGAWGVDGDRQTNQNLHATWIDTDGGVWAVGGQFDTPPMRAGVLLHKGEALQGTFP
jgi:hypothetical protein